MNLIRRVFALTAAAAIAALVPVTIGACGSASAPTGGSTSAHTNGLEQKSPADVLRQVTAALKAATSVHIVGASPDGRIDARIQPGAATGTLTKDGHKVRVTIIGSSDGYFYADKAGMKMMGIPPEMQSQVAGRWLKMKVSGSAFTGFTLAGLASQLTSYTGPLEPKVSQATLDGEPVVVLSWRDGGKLYVANTGPAYPLRGDFKGPQAGRVDFADYGAHFQITAPTNVINVSG